MLAVVLIAATLLPLIPSNEWWIRIFDFPRFQIVVLILVVLGWAAGTRVWDTRRGQTLAAALILSLVYQMSRILPYTPLWRTEVPMAASCSPGDRLRHMEVNVLQSNRDARPLLALVRERRPDVLLLTETDQWWVDQLGSLASEMPHIVSVPKDNTYGMVLLSRRPLANPRIRYLFEPGVPSIRAGLKLASGRRIELHAIHPRPPVPGHDTAERDAELVKIGREVRARRLPAIVAGDLNDVAWSDTTALFQQVSGLLDPRVGRRLMPTFPADLPLLRWPLDYVFVSPGFTLLHMERLDDIGSDHLPIIVELCASGLAHSTLPSARLDAETRAEARETLKEGREEAAADR